MVGPGTRGPSLLTITGTDEDLDPEATDPPLAQDKATQTATQTGQV